ncbi:DUF3306 domain-containing protein [Aquabacterium sp. A08]|uniref:DUF3306 domain-containing protein n=1 Tax=Aquabacterium sp. A08 TaxID=2718532 RepID=UPI0014239C8E|nr:DUF3306 domain-containing protein [Aquabacterium sp. A08]NIC40460.1 DUF3306 domain-containing protein [Aquabacterium sp. A08]
MADDGGFFSRWSRRKAAERAAVAPAPAHARPLPVAPAPAVEAPPPAAGPGARSAVVAAPAAVPPPTGPAGAADMLHSPAPADADAPARPANAPAPLGLDDVRRLTPDADFRPFVARDVAPEVRNAAFKKLFADPKFNVMDGLDIYIDDYSQPDPLPASLARQLVSARSLGLFDDTPAPGAEPAANAPAPLGPSDGRSHAPDPAAVPDQVPDPGLPAPATGPGAVTSLSTDTAVPPPTVPTPPAQP